ncbi:MAG: polyphosphate kinase 2 [Alphaproteobacteria bacterium]|nr:polyphosphate kinase 2 [Alphaproteobacteria bacterium]
MPLPFDGEISRFYNHDIPADVRKAIKNAQKDDILTEDYPYADRWGLREYEKTLSLLQIELVKLQAWAKDSGTRIAVLFEGRDAAGKGGTIKRFREFMNPRSARIVALSKPSDRESTEWYFQRYIKHLPAGGEIVFFDRSWYNRAVIEHVFGFCTSLQREQFFTQVASFEDMLVNDGITLIKIWLNVGKTEQLRRFHKRESDPLKQWKLSSIDVQGLSKWQAYSEAIGEMFARTHTEIVPWTLIRSDDKRRARVAALQAVLFQIDYARKDPEIAHLPDPKICGGTDLWHA